MCWRAPERRAAGAGLLFGLACLAPGAAVADVYRTVDGKGVIHLTDHPLGPDSVLVVRSPAPRASVRPDPANRDRFRHLVDEAARRHGVNQALIDAVITAESGYDPNAISRAGAVGLMQLMPETARAYGVTDRRDPSENVHAGTRHLRDLLERYRSLPLALAAYNAGEGAVARYELQIPPFPETQHYVAKVTRLFRENLERARGPTLARNP